MLAPHRAASAALEQCQRAFDGIDSEEIHEAEVQHVRAEMTQVKIQVCERLEFKSGSADVAPVFLSGDDINRVQIGGFGEREKGVRETDMGQGGREGEGFTRCIRVQHDV